ncbi:olfactory receptor 6N2-like [Sphaeramia orbicularis]|uniref:olfactory receptor 6N2-like n=1 Tax=Sphaeramia orbicularis TaxID=375764 RepID=UPI00117C4AB5|nr:olfactory receptor 6N2-like [Sphaeramia orbicularis]
MDVKSNVTYLKFGGFVDMNKYRYVYFVILFMVYVLIMCSNSIIVYLILIHKNLHEPMYVFIAALSFNSVLFSTVIYPKLLTDFLSEKQIISLPACIFQYFMYYSLAASDFLLLAAMAFDRYVSICKPLQYPTIMRKSTVTIFLFLAWLLPVAQIAGGVLLGGFKKLCTFTLTGIFCNNSILKLNCVPSAALAIYGVVGLINFAVIPALFVLFTYAKIFIITYNRGREVRKKAAETCLPHLMVLFSFSFLCAYDIITARLDSNFSKTVRLVMSLQTILYNPLLNPIIYGLKMKEILRHLKKLFCQITQITLCMSCLH